MKTIRIFCEQSYVFEIQNESYLVDSGNFLEIECLNKLVAKVYPVDQDLNSLPFCFLLEQKENKIICNSKNIKVYNFKQRADVFVFPFCILSQDVVYTKAYTLKNVKYNISCYTDRVCVYTGGVTYTQKLQCQSASSDTSGGFVNILCQANNTKTYVRFNAKDKKFYFVNGEQIQIEEGVITSKRNICDTQNHIVVTTYENNETLKKQKTELYIEKNYTNTSLNCLIPYKFFEALQIKDFELAKKLSSIVLDNNQLEDYFGEFEKFDILSFSPLVYTLYSKESAVDYKIEIENNLIAEIDEI